jgi:IMP dehydrogenase
MKIIQDGITFDDVLLVPSHSNIMPHETDISTHLARSIPLKIPLVSAAMDSVTESRMALGLFTAI